MLNILESYTASEQFGGGFKKNEGISCLVFLVYSEKAVGRE